MGLYFWASQLKRRKLSAASESGAVSPLMALLLIPLIGVIGLTTETASWQLFARSMQNAADSAALTAAANNNPNTYASEARAVATRYGFTSGVNNVTVTPLNNQPCPAPSTQTNCYRVTISRNVPISLVRVVGYQGDVALNGGRAKTLASTAVASPRSMNVNYCMVGLGTGSDVIRINGGPNVDLTGCNMRANGQLTCNGAGSDTGVVYGDAGPGQSSSCGQIRRGNQPTLADPYSALTVPAHGCDTGNSPRANKDNVDAAHQISGGNKNWTTQVYCGDVKLTGNVSVTSANTILVIGNGRLDLAGFTLSTSSTGSLTIVFSGTSSSSGQNIPHYPYNSTGTGVLDYKAPSLGGYSGVAMMQDRTLTGSKNDVDFTYSGSNPTFNITGLLYLPNSDFQISGAINHHTGGFACLGVVAKTILINGNGSIFANPTSECDRAGLTLPTVSGAGNLRQTLVQ